MISVTSNVCPQDVKQICDHALLGDFETASLLQQQIGKLTECLFCEVNPIPVKAAMKILGYDCGNCRMPLTSLLPEHEEKLRKLLAS